MSTLRRIPKNTIYQRGTPEIDATLQAQLVQDLIAQGVDAICVVPVDPESLERCLSRPALPHRRHRP